jgi:sulfite reductase (ferredoxin)
MQSFRTELENPLVEQDIIDLEKKIRMFRAGEIHEDKFRSLRLARGVYGQRQHGVQMVRIKLPYGKMTFRQWKRIADISDEYSNGNLHLTTRQDIQIHFVSLDRTPELWQKLEQDNVTLREACGNTVRNITAADTAGIDPNEPFDVTPYAHTLFEYLLRNPICQEMGRKIKMSFSNTDEDTALAYIHDVGFIPKLKEGKRGFKIYVGGGLGSQPMMAQLAYEFLPEERIIPFVEAVLRVFDRHGERNSRSKARMKFLIQKIGFEAFMEFVNAEYPALKNQEVHIKTANNEVITVPFEKIETAIDEKHFAIWKKTNVISQKQEGLFAAYIRISLGNISSDDSRSLITDLEGFVGDDVRVTINQGLLLRNIPEANLPFVFNVLSKYGLAAAGANSTANITACPGTDTCNLAISDSTNISLEFERMMKDEYADLVQNNDIKIKISGCMNSCGQHSMAHIGFHGSSLKAADKRVLPALQVCLGGGSLGDGEGRASEKVIKVPSKKGPEVLRFVFDDYAKNKIKNELFNTYFDRQGKNYFYELLKPLASLENLKNSDFVDWGHEVQFETAIGVGECASVMVDLIGILLMESEEKISLAKGAFEKEAWADAIYLAYAAQINSAKAILLDKEINCSTQTKIIKEYTEKVDAGFEDVVMQINKVAASKEFAVSYIQQAEAFCIKLATERNEAHA